MDKYQSLTQKLHEVLDEGKRNTNKEMSIINNFVALYRKKCDIEPTSGIKEELSCFMFGEGYNLLYRQLVNTDNTDGSWCELGDASIRELVLQQIRKDLSKIK